MSEAAPGEGALLAPDTSPSPALPPPHSPPDDDRNVDVASPTVLTSTHVSALSPAADSDDEENEYDPDAGPPPATLHSAASCTQPSSKRRTGSETSRSLFCLSAESDEGAVTAGQQPALHHTAPIPSSSSADSQPAASTASSSAASSPSARSKPEPAPPRFQAADYESRRSGRSHAAVSYKEKVTTPLHTL